MTTNDRGEIMAAAPAIIAAGTPAEAAAAEAGGEYPLVRWRQRVPG